MHRQAISFSSILMDKVMIMAVAIFSIYPGMSCLPVFNEISIAELFLASNKAFCCSFVRGKIVAVFVDRWKERYWVPKRVESGQRRFLTFRRHWKSLSAGLISDWWNGLIKQFVSQFWNYYVFAIIKSKLENMRNVIK